MNPSNETSDGDLLVPVFVVRAINRLVFADLTLEHFVDEFGGEEQVEAFIGLGILIDAFNLARTELAQRMIMGAEVGR